MITLNIGYVLHAFIKKFYHNSSFNDSRLVFPPKGVEADDFSGSLVRHPGKTRPISLSNTDSKHISSCIALPLNALASSSVAAFQKGGRG